MANQRSNCNGSKHYAPRRVKCRRSAWAPRSFVDQDERPRRTREERNDARGSGLGFEQAIVSVADEVVNGHSAVRAVILNSLDNIAPVRGRGRTRVLLQVEIAKP